MDSRQRCLEEQLRRTQSEASELRGNLRELGRKFFQLERAFEMNLKTQALREVEFNRMKLENEELRKMNAESVRARTTLNSILTNTTTQTDHWKNAFLRQREVIERKRIERDNAVALVKEEYEDILKTSRETAEKEFREIVEQCEEAREKVTRLEERIGTYEDSERAHGERTSQLANLLETLKRFDVDVGSVCQLAAETLKNLTERGNLFEESMRNLRHLAGAGKDRKDEPRLVLLREQNSVLREVVKKLKREMLERTRNEIPKSEDEKRYPRVLLENERNSRNDNGNLLNRSTLNENTILAQENSLNPSIRKNNYDNDEKKCKEQDDDGSRVRIGANKNENRNKFDIESTTIDMRGKMTCFESHSNGVVYEEYVFKLSTDREIKMKYPVLLKNIETMVRLEFVDNETDYENTPPDRMLILFKNIHAVVNVKQTGIPCSTQTMKMRTSNNFTQTMKMRTSNNFTQTTVTGINSFSRLNAGTMMLNSEKRAIERSLCNLERSVKTLKLNALNQAEAMIGKNSHLFGTNEMLDHIKVLTG